MYVDGSESAMVARYARIDHVYHRRLRNRDRYELYAYVIGFVCGTCYGGIDGQDIRLSAEDLGRFLDDIQRMFLLYATLPIKVGFQEGNVGLALLGL
jgi:hypothetical protein